MVEFLTGMPQGLYWYPLIMGLLLYATVTSLRLFRKSGGGGGRRAQVKASGGGFTSLIAMARADRFSELELERLCLSYLLQINGYSGYSTAACRAFLEDTGDVELILAIQEHLGDAPRERHPVPAGEEDRIAPLPPRCQLIVSRVQSQIEENP